MKSLGCTSREATWGLALGCSILGALMLMLVLAGCASSPHCKPKCGADWVCRWAWTESSGPFGTSTSHGPAECHDAQGNPLPSPSPSPRPVVCYAAPGREWRCVTYSEEKSCCVLWTMDPKEKE